ncbi:MAG: hypothetical protein Q4C30_06940 [Bacteroidia bacterium]|nr:hypothetical protein [Bacteroidia bacterium]
MYRIFNKNSLGAFIMLPILLLIYRIRLISNPTLGMAANDADLYTPIWNATLGHITMGSTLSIAVAIGLTFLTLLIVNNTYASYRFSRNVTFLPACVFIILSSGFVIGQGLHPVLVFVIFYAIGMHRLFEVIRPDAKPYRYCFEAMINISIGSLFWAKGLWLVPLMIVSAGMLKVLGIRTLGCMLWGLLAPWVIVGTLAYVTDDLEAFIESYEQSLVVPVAFYKTWMMGKTFLLVYGAVLFLSIISAMRNSVSLSTWQSRMVRVIIWMVIYPSVLIISPYFSFEVQILVATGGAGLVSVWLQRQKRQLVSEIVLTLFTLFTLTMQWII